MLLSRALFIAVLPLLLALAACTVERPISPGIRAMVADATTGKPLAGVRVSANDDTGRATTSDDEGWFRLQPAFRKELMRPDGGFHYAPVPTLKLRLIMDGYEATFVSTDAMNSYKPIRMKQLPANLRNH